MKSLLIRNLFFAILQPGVVAVLIPCFILGNNTQMPFYDLNILQYSGVLLIIAGLAGLTWCIISFASQGRGTLSPADPTTKLVISGLYRFSRNPMYISVTAMLTGETMFFQSLSLLLYTLGIFILFNIYIINFEEKRLKKAFGDAYISYCSRVRRWL